MDCRLRCRDLGPGPGQHRELHPGEDREKHRAHDDERQRRSTPTLFSSDPEPTADREEGDRHEARTDPTIRCESPQRNVS
jgi:hypothetical protein